MYKRMQNYFKSKGIKHQLTAPYTPEQNGVAERKNRSLMEMARCMLYDADMHIKFWAEAVNNANYIQNRLLSAAVSVTPFELWFGKSPNLSHVRVFGVVAYVQLNKQLIMKKSTELDWSQRDFPKNTVKTTTKFLRRL